MSKEQRDAFENWLYDFLSKHGKSKSEDQLAYEIAEHVYPDAPAPIMRWRCEKCGMCFQSKPIVHYSVDIDGAPLDWCNGLVEDAPTIS